MSKKIFGTLLLFIILCAFSVNAQQGPCATQLGPLKPDLSIKISEVSFTIETFPAESCAVQEGYLSSPGTHSLMRFTTTTPNKGDADLYLGKPSDCPELYWPAEQTCHGHAHLRDYAEYRLWTDAGYSKWVRVRNLGVPVQTKPI